jgi:hypothetical protein
MWYYLYRATMLAINDTLRLKNVYMEPVPIASPSSDIRAETELIVAKLIEMSRISYDRRQLLFDWLRTEFEVQEPGRRLENVVDLDCQSFVEEVRKRRSKTAKKLTPTTLKALRDGYTEQIGPLQQEQVEAIELERRISDLVNNAYGLTEEEVAVLWSTAPPRMPLSSPSLLQSVGK